MKEKFILCGDCGAKNRIEMGTGRLICGNCGKRLAVPGRAKSKLWTGLACLIIMFLSSGTIAYFWLESSESRPLPTQLTNRPQIKNLKQDKSASKGTRLILVSSPVAISTGVVKTPPVPGVSLLSIMTRFDYSYFIELLDIYNGPEVMTMYVEGGYPFETLVPLGTYEIRYATGKTWYGIEHLFGPETSFFRASHRFEFAFDGQNYSGYEIELIQQVGGNLPTRPISRSDF